MHSIQLCATLTNFPYFSARRHHPKFRAVAKKIWERDRHTCQFCGFQAQDYQEVINLDQNYKNNHLSNLITACVFCTQCYFLESLGDEGYGGGTLIYMPEFTQGELNSFCHVLFCAMANQTQYRETAQTIYQMLKLRSNFIEEQFGEGMSEPANFAQVLLDYQTTQKQLNLKQIFQDLRLLPARGRFSKQIEHWAKAAAKK